MAYNFKNKKILVVGSGISGVAAADLLSQAGASVILYDSNRKLTEETIRGRLKLETEAVIVIGRLQEEICRDIDLVILSPGVPTDLPYVTYFMEHGTKVWGEVELAYHFSHGRIAAITGTNGKTTTTALVGEIMKTYFNEVFIVGNIGVPYTRLVQNTGEQSVTVAEMSSFQLETIHDFKPDVSAILNISPDHLDRHHTMENYIAAKFRITENQDENQTCVLNYDDTILRNFGERINTKVFYFSSSKVLDNGIYYKDDNIIYAKDKEERIICNIHEQQLLGMHNYENIMAAAAICLNLNVPFENIRRAIINFQTVEHRIEYVDTIRGVKYYNDSKGTNPDAAIKGIEAMVTRTLLIGGGYDKDSEYGEWIRSFKGKVRYLVLIGETKEKIAKTARENGFNHIIFADSLKEAVDICAEKAEEGDCVLLSPACASWGMFKNYEERGKLFKEYVRMHRDA